MSELLESGDSGDLDLGASTDSGGSDTLDMGPPRVADGLDTTEAPQDSGDLGSTSAPKALDTFVDNASALDEQVQTESESEAVTGEEDLDVGSEDSTINDRGEGYPEIIDPRTGEPIPFPEGDLEIVPQDERVGWGAAQRQAFIQEWNDRGYEPPPGGWEECEIHHIKPREYGGTNDFENLVPVLATEHRGLLNPWWSGLKSG